MSGISILRRLLMKEAMKKNAPFQNEGIMSISKALITNVDSKVNRIVEGAKRQGIDFDKYNEQEVKYILELNKPKGPRVISADSPEGRGITKALLGRKEGKVIKGDFGKPFKEEVETMRGGKKFPTAKDPEDLATGGRVGFDKGGMSRRKFMQIMGGLAALPVVGKLFKGAKIASKVPQVVKTAPVPGKPEWFDSLVNKVIAEGDDVTKKLATKEREIVHIKKIDEDSTVTVTQDLDEGIVRVEYDSPENTFADTVQLQYKKPLPDEVNPNPKAQFDVAESGPVGRSVGPDDYDIDVDEVGGTSIKDLDSDVSKLKEYATGKKPTLKEIVQNKKRKDKAKAITEDPAAQSDAVTARQGDADDSFYSGSDYGDVDDFASGGRVGLLSGGGVLRVILQNLAKQYGKKPSELLAVTNYKSLPPEVRKFLTKEQFEAIKKDMQKMRVEQFQNIRDMIENRQQFDKSSKALEKMGMNVSDTVLPKMMDKGPVPGGTTSDDLLMMEQIIKNLQMKDRKLNASGGLAGMLGE